MHRNKSIPSISPKSSHVRRFPVLIGGCDRSGTTMLGALLGTNSQAICTPESQFITHLWTDRNIDPHNIDGRALAIRVFNSTRFRLFWPQVQQWDVPEHPPAPNLAGLVHWIIDLYAQTTNKPESRWWIDQTPSNRKRLQIMFEMFPEAKFIHLVRDGRAVAASFLPLDWGPNDIVNAARFWMERCAAGLAAELRFGPDRVLRVYYEDIITESTQTLKRICKFTGMSFEPGMLQGAGYTLPSYSQGQHRLVGHRPDRSRIDAWQNRLTQREVELFEYVSGDFLSLLGYRLHCEGRTRPPSQIELIRLHAKRACRLLLNGLRHRRRIRHGLRATRSR